MVEPNDIVVDKYNLDAHANDRVGEKDQVQRARQRDVAKDTQIFKIRDGSSEQ